jgi:malate permease and related proteins
MIDMNIDVINQVIVLFLMMLVGVYATKRGFVNKEVEKGLSELLLNITLPFLIVSTFNLEFDNSLLANAKSIAVYSIIIHIVLYVFSKVFFFKMPKEKQPVLRFITTFSNVGFMGYPVLQSIFGDVGVFYGAIYNMVFNVFVWTLGVSLYSGKKSFKSFIKVLKNPAFIAVCTGLILFISPITLPVPIYKTLKLIGDTTTPISMIIVGAMLSSANLKEVLSDWTIYIGSFACLVITPIIIYFGMVILGVSNELIRVCVVIVSMPGAVMAPIIAAKYGGNAEYASQCVFLSTILSVITIPIVILALFR